MGNPRQQLYAETAIGTLVYAVEPGFLAVPVLVVVTTVLGRLGQLLYERLGTP